MVAGTAQSATGAGAGRDGGTTGIVGLYTSTDAGEHWTAVDVPEGPVGAATAHVDTRPLARIGGGDLPTVAVDPGNERVVYSASTVMWRTRTAASHWSAVRGASGGDDYQKIWINPNTRTSSWSCPTRAPWCRRIVAESWSNWYTQPTAAMYHVTTDNAFPYRVCGGQQDSGSACVQSRSNDGMITFHDWHPVNIQEYGIAAPDPKNPDLVYGSARTDVSLYNRRTGQTTHVGPDMGPRPGGRASTATCGRCRSSGRRSITTCSSTRRTWCGRRIDRGHTWTRISPDLSRQTWTVPASAGKYASTVKPAAEGTITALSASPLDVGVLWAGTDDGNIQVTMDGGAKWANVTPPAIKPWTRIFNIEAGHFDRGTAYAAANTMRIDDMNPHFWRTHDGGKTWTEIDTGIAAWRGRQLDPGRPAPERAALRRQPTRRCGSPSTTAITGSRCGRTCRPSRCATSRSRTTQRASAPI